MKIIKRLKVPTGDIVIAEGQKGKLEFLSIGDYGQDVNLKCDFLGLHEVPDKVEHQQMLPLEKKWVITISTQYGCSMGCKFCDVPKVGTGKNATCIDLLDQIAIGLSLHPEVTYSERLNIHFARMGEPTFNKDVLKATKILKGMYDHTYKLHPVVSTMMPKKNKFLRDFIEEWVFIKNYPYQGNAGLQLSINSTSDKERDYMFSNSSLTLEGIAKTMEGFIPKGRKFTLNFAVSDYEIDPDILLKYFDPELYIVKLTPMHQTHTALNNGISTHGDVTTFSPHEEYEKSLTKAGYDVLVFITSLEEDLSRITCGNAILSGSMPLTDYQVVTQ